MHANDGGAQLQISAMEQRTGNTPTQMCPMNFERVVTAVQWRNNSLFKKWCCSKWTPVIVKTIDLSPTLFAKLTQMLNIKHKTINLLEIFIRGNIGDSKKTYT